MRRNGARTIGAMVAILLAATACNPLVGNQSEPGTTGSWTANITYTGDEGGWFEVRVRGAGDDDLTVAATVATFADDLNSRVCWEDGDDAIGVTVPCFDPLFDSCPFTTAARQAWSDGASLGYRRLAWLEPGDLLALQIEGSPDPVTFDLSVVDDEGEPVGTIDYGVSWADGEKFISIGLPIC